MARLLGLRVKNYKSLADVAIGRLSSSEGDDLSSVSCFIGRNGCGKSSLLDVFAFISDCLREGIEAACDKEHRGGFERLRTQGRTGPIVFELYFRLSEGDRPMKYQFSVDETNGIPHVRNETLWLAKKGSTHGRLREFLKLENGTGFVWVLQDDEVVQTKGRQEVELEDLDHLAIATYGQLPDHPRIGAFRKYLESWYLSYFVPGDARRLPSIGAQRRLDRTGSNLGNVLQYMERQHGDALKDILAEIANAIPGVKAIKTNTTSADKRLLIEFSEQGYKDPFFQYAMSDGTLKMFAYLLLLHDPDPPAFIGIEEPENGLYHQLHGHLSSELLKISERYDGRTQILVTTHSPYFVDSLEPDMVWTLKKNNEGTSRVKRANDVRGVKQRIESGTPLGNLWYQNFLEDEA